MAYDDLIFASNALVAYWKAMETVPPSAPPNSEFIDIAGGFHGTLQPNSVGGWVPNVGSPGPILTDASSWGSEGGLARIPSLGPNTGAIFMQFAQTWNVWFQRPDPDPSDGVHMLMNRGNDATNTYLSIAQRSTGNYQGQLICSLDWSGEFRGCQTCVVTPNAWHMGTMTYDGVSVIKLFLDGWLVDVNTNALPGPLTDNNPWRMGYVANPIFGAVHRSYYSSHYHINAAEIDAGTIWDWYVAAVGAPAPSPCEGAISPSPSPSNTPSSSPSASPSSSASASPIPCTPPLGRAISAINSKGRLFITLASEDFTSQVAYAWHEGAQRMPITSMTNWKGSLRPLSLFELDAAFEIDNTTDGPMIVSLHRNLRKNYVRDARVNTGSNRIDSLTAGFDQDNVGDMIVVFGQNIGGLGIHYIIGRIAATASPSSSPSPSASPSASPSTTESASPSGSPSASPSSSRSSTASPSHSPSASPSSSPSRTPSASPSRSPSSSPSASPSQSPSASPSAS